MTNRHFDFGTTARRGLLAVPLGLGIAASALAGCGDGPDAVTATAVPTAAANLPSKDAPTKNAPTPKAAPSVGPIILDNPTVTASGLKYTDQVVGTGATPTATQTVSVNYTGSLAANGLQFDASAIHGGPQSFPLNQVVKGFAEGISTMKVGGKRTVFIPAALAYGANPPPGSGIPANADLVFTIELVSIK